MVDIDASAAAATTVTLTVVLAAGAIVGSAQKLLVSAHAHARGPSARCCASAEAMRACPTWAVPVVNSSAAQSAAPAGVCEQPASGGRRDRCTHDRRGQR